MITKLKLLMVGTVMLTLAGCLSPGQFGLTCFEIPAGFDGEYTNHCTFVERVPGESK